MSKLNFPASEIASKEDIEKTAEQIKEEIKNTCVVKKDDSTMLDQVYARRISGPGDVLYVEDHDYFKMGMYMDGVLPLRQKNGNLYTNTPDDDLDCANKKYVNDITDDKANDRIPKPSVQVGAPIETVRVMNHNDYTVEEDENGAYHYTANDSAFRDVIIDGGNVWPKNNVGAAGKSLPMRDSEGNLWTGAPIDDQDCVPYSMYKALLERIEALEQKA